MQSHKVNNILIWTLRIIRGLATVSVVQIAAGEDHCLALTSGGRLFAWGSNQFGQLGLGPNIGDKITVPQVRMKYFARIY